MIYLDNSATTRVREEVAESMVPYLLQKWGNPSSVHGLGRDACDGLRLAREEVAAFLNCSVEEIYFSSCGTMSNNVALLGRARFAEANGLGRHLITTCIEHPSVMGPCKFLESQGWEVTYLPVDREGFVTIDAVRAATKSNTSILSVMWANNEVGTVQPIAQIAEFAREREIYFHTDAVQVPGKLEINLSEVPISALALSGHKFYAPKGVGILYIKRGQNVMPILFGGGQEFGLLPGTEALPNIVAIGKAAALARKDLTETAQALRLMQKVILEKISAVDGVKITGPADLARRLPGHASFVLPGVEGEAIVMRADMKGICISSGSACHKGIIEPSEVLRAMGFTDNEAKGSIRIAAGRFNTVEECETACSLITEILISLRDKTRSARVAG